MRFIVSSFVLLSLVTLTGCGPKSDGNFFVTGTVTHGGQPLEDARVVFIPDGGSGEGASGRTDASGKYVLTTSSGNDASGTKPGEYRVTVSKTELVWDGRSYLPTESGDPDAEPVKDEKTVHLLPTEYGNFSTTPFRAVVTESRDGNVFDFAIP